MSKRIWRIVGRFVLLMALQLLVLNHVYLGGYVMPMLYVLFILMLPTDTGRIPMLLIAFGTGLLVDVMNNMLGFHALACTVVAMLRILFADRIRTRGEPVTIQTPSVYSVTPQYFISSIWCFIPWNCLDSAVSAVCCCPRWQALSSPPFWQRSTNTFS